MIEEFSLPLGIVYLIVKLNARYFPQTAFHAAWHAYVTTQQKKEEEAAVFGWRNGTASVEVSWYSWVKWIIISCEMLFNQEKRCFIWWLDFLN